MEKQTNMRLVETEKGQLLIRKCIDDDGELAVKFSLIHDQGEYYIEPTVTMSFKTDELQNKAFNKEDLDDMFIVLMESIEDYL